MMKMPKVWELMSGFKDSCRCRGWRTSESEDWINIGDEYHNFVLAKDIHPTSFRKMASNRKCVICEGLSYRVVEAANTAWLFYEAPSEALVKAVSENSALSEKVALYDLSPLLNGQNLCGKLNCTESPVFKEFESFLRDEMKLELSPLTPLSGSEAGIGGVSAVQLA